MKTLKNFTKQYQVQKTLKFELIPQRETQKNIDKNKSVIEDEIRNDNYQKVKLVIDNIHKYFIENTLNKVECDWSILADAIKKYRKDKSENNKKNLLIEQEVKRKEIINWFIGKSGTNAFKEKQKIYFDKLFKKELFTDILVDKDLKFNKETEEAINSFNKFTTYFVGFHENRKNMYSHEEKSTSVAYRIVNDNFPKFLSNCEAYEELKKICPEILEEAEKELKLHEAFRDLSLDNVFNVESYNEFISQSKIDYYNQILGGISGYEGSKKIRGVNEVINNAIQQNDELKNSLKGKQVTLTQLFKQILSDKVTFSFISEQFANDEDVINAVESFNECIVKNNSLCIIKNMFKDLNLFNLEKVYISNKELTNVSNSILGDWSKIRNTLLEDKKSLAGPKISKAKLEAIEREIKNKDFSISELNDYTFIKNNGDQVKITDVSKAVLEVVDLLEESLKVELPKNLKTTEDKNKIKTILDNYTELLHVLKWFKSSPDNDLDSDFYGELYEAYVEIEQVMNLYNKVRNYVTKKPYSLEKFKLNFSMPSLASGWDKNKESQSGAIIMLKDRYYYLGVINHQNKPKIVPDEVDGEYYKKMVYKMFPDIAKMIGKCTIQLKEVKNHFENSEEDYILDDPERFIDEVVVTKEIYDLSTTTYDGKKKYQIDYLRNTGDEEGYYEALGMWIDFVKDFLKKYRSTHIYNFDTLLATNQYERLDIFYGDVDNICYKIDYENISEKQINKLVKEGKLYLFKIYNKDFSEFSTGKENLHTMYWKAIFSEENMKDVVVKLNGGAELFFRPKSNMAKIKHEVGEKLVNRTNTEGEPISDSIYKEIFLYANGKLSKDDLSAAAKKELPLVIIKDVKHTITKDKRYHEDKYFFHVPITLNYKAADKIVKFNTKVQNYLRNNKDINIIGIDRGERNLLYVVVINQKGEIIDKKQISYNKVNGYDYYTKLDQREKERIEAKQAWDTVGKIKELKEGYLSLVVREIADMMIKYNAIVVMENLNAGFKRVRGGIAEKAVYQKFEKMLIDKLNYLVFKDEEPSNAGGILNAYQLTDKFESFEKMDNQSGFLFYVPAAYTSKIDPVTGFANVFSTRHITNTETKKEFICNFDSLIYDEASDKFYLECDLSKFKVVATSYVKKWKFVIGGKRIIYNSKDKTYIEKYPCEDMKRILIGNDIDFNKDNILEVIKSLGAEKENAKLFDSIYWIIMNTLQLRNSNASTNEDYIISPVANEDGKVFDSRTCSYDLPKDADANGAYHIALKGLYVLNKINETEENEKVDMKIKNEDWFEFVQTKNYAKIK